MELWRRTKRELSDYVGSEGKPIVHSYVYGESINGCSVDNYPEELLQRTGTNDEILG